MDENQTKGTGKVSAKDYRFITNFKKDELKTMYITLQAAEIQGHIFVEKAYDAAGNLLEDMHALYFPVSASERDVELFWQASGIVCRMIEKKE